MVTEFLVLGAVLHQVNAFLAGRSAWWLDVFWFRIFDVSFSGFGVFFSSVRRCGALSTSLGTLVFHEDRIEIVVAESLHGFTVIKLISAFSGETEPTSSRTVLDHHGSKLFLATLFDILFTVDNSS